MTTAVAVNRIGETSRAAIPNWDQELNGAKMLLRSGLAPDSIKTPEACLFIILVGRDLGLSAVQSLRGINVIKGKVEVAADLQLALFKHSGGRFRWLEMTEEVAAIELHADWLVGPHVERFTMVDARRAGLISANATYSKYPRSMLRARAITSGLKSIGFDPTAGVYAIGELGESLAQEPTAAVTEEVSPVEPELGDWAEPDDTVEATADDLEEDAVVAAERRALAGIRAILPTLAPNQRDYVSDQLRDGADPVKLLEVMKERVGA